MFQTFCCKDFGNRKMYLWNETLSRQKIIVGVGGGAKKSTFRCKHFSSFGKYRLLGDLQMVQPSQMASGHGNSKYLKHISRIHRQKRLYCEHPISSIHWIVKPALKLLRYCSPLLWASQMHLSRQSFANNNPFASLVGMSILVASWSWGNTVGIFS